MKFDKKSSRQEILPPSSQRSHLKQNSQLQSKCPRCKSVPKKMKQAPHIHMINQQKVVKQSQGVAVKERSIRKKKSKSVYEETEPGFQNETLTYALKKKDMKRQSNSYSKLLQEDSQESTMVDHVFEKKYKKSQNELLSTKSRLYENECEKETLHSELKKVQKENILLREKVKHREREGQQCIKKAVKYKQIAKNLKISLDTKNSQLEHLKQTTQQEISNLQQSATLLEKVINSRSTQYSTNLKTIMSYLQKIQKMMSQSDQNFSFNQKILNDLMDLISQFQKAQIEDDESMKDSLMSNCFLSNAQNNDLELVFSQTTNNDHQTGNKQGGKGEKGDLSYRTKKLLNDYEKMKYESERLKEENRILKQRRDLASLEESQERTNYESKESQYQNNQLQSLSVADILQFDSVQKLNNKLEEKNHYLEEQINLMRKQMKDLTDQTHSLLKERDNQQLQVLQQRSHLMSITEEYKAQTNSSEKYQRINFNDNKENEEVKTKKYYNEVFQYNKPNLSNFQSPTLATQSDDLEYPVPRIPIQDRKELTQRLPLKQIIKPSCSTNNIIMNNIESHRSLLSKVTSQEGSRQKNNIFKRNCYLESEKENIVSARDNHLETIDFSQNQSNQRKSFATQNIASPSSFQANQRAEVNYPKKEAKQTFKRPMSLGSTSTNVINEKAKALRDEISTLDEEILQLQNNLRKAISKKDVKKY